MLFNSIIREKPYHLLNIFTSAARLSSVNIVRFWLVPLINENPCFIFYIKQFTAILDKINGTKTSHHGLNERGL